MTLQQLASLRYLRHHRAQCVLAVSGVALGVAIVVAIQLVQAAARQAFDDALRGVFGSATHVVRGARPTFDERLLATVRRTAATWHPLAVLEAPLTVVVDGRPTTLRLLGVDTLAMPLDTAGPPFPLGPFLLEPGTVVIGDATATRLGIAAGATLRTVAGTTLHVLTVASATPRLGLVDGVVLADLATAQEVLGAAGRLSRIELTAPAEGASTGVTSALAAALPGGVAVEASGAAAAGGGQVTRAFYTNLDALSLLAVMVGGFMIYNTMAFFVVQRAALFARLRALGVTRRALAGQVAFEAAVLGTLGGVVGDALGVLLARRLAGPMAQTLADHYQSTGIGHLALSPPLAVAGVLLALVTTLAAALVPAWQAASLPPGQALAPSARRAREIAALRWTRWASALCLFAGVALLGGSTRSLHAGFAALAALLLAAMLAVPGTIGMTLGLLARHAGTCLPLPERLALSSATHALARIGLAVAALMAATATSIGVGLMVVSFRVAVGDWLEQLLRADFYLAQEDAERAAPAVTPSLVADIATLPGVAAVSRVRRLETALASGARVRVTAYDLPPAARAGFRFVGATSAEAWSTWSRGDAVFVTEPYAWHHRLQVGDRVVFATPCGRLERPVAGVYRDYGSEQGAIALTWSLYRRCWRDERAHGLGVYPAPGHDAAALRDRLEQLAAASAVPPVQEAPGTSQAALRMHGALVVWSNAEVRVRSLEIFDRTFAVTDVLTLVAAIVAALGVFNALLALHIEHAREYAVLRATGISRGGLRRTLLAQTAFVAVAAVACAVPVGVAIALLLIEVINRRSFGWSMEFTWQAGALILPALLALLAALAATVYPATRAVAVPPAAALRHD